MTTSIGGQIMSKKLLPFQRKLRRCPKCGGKTKRFYCKGETVGKDCWTYSSGLEGKEHFDVTCQECHFKFYEKVKP